MKGVKTGYASAPPHLSSFCNPKGQDQVYTNSIPSLYQLYTNSMVPPKHLRSISEVSPRYLKGISVSPPYLLHTSSISALIVRTRDGIEGE